MHAIKTSISHIRKRPAMYLGGFSFMGLKTILQNLIEIIVNNNKKKQTITIKIYKKNRITFECKNIDTTFILKELVAIKNNKNTNCENDYKLLSLLALSKNLKIKVRNYNTQLIADGINGSNEITVLNIKAKEQSFLIDFTLDELVLKEFTIEYELILIFLKQLAYLNPLLKIIVIDKTNNELQRNVLHYPKGIFSQLDFFVAKIDGINKIHSIYIEDDLEGFKIKIAIGYSKNWYDESAIFTYANNIKTTLGGTLNNAINCGIMLAIKKIGLKNGFKINIKKATALNHSIVIAAINGNDLIFSGGTKQKLGMPALQPKIKNIVCKHLTHEFGINSDFANYVLSLFSNYCPITDALIKKGLLGKKQISQA